MIRLPTDHSPRGPRDGPEALPEGSGSGGRRWPHRGRRSDGHGGEEGDGGARGAPGKTTLDHAVEC